MRQILQLILLFTSVCSFAQQSPISAGGDMQNATGSISFSVGQIATNSIETGNKLNEGVQQPREFFQVVSIESISKAQIFSVFPNPTTGIIQLKSEELHDASVQIIDEAGRIVWENNYQNLLTTDINLTSFADGLYSIIVTSGNSIQNIKIIKN
ncbi:MAG TPA: T9SS type A sorting domain-containing protein [Taishania sp.]|nr:T9SS type A sorting domain-containing protein [Taishania sp.]